jgi:hypothetical protein
MRRYTLIYLIAPRAMLINLIRKILIAPRAMLIDLIPPLHDLPRSEFRKGGSGGPSPYRST